MIKVNEWKRWLLRLGYEEIPRTERLIPSGFAARQENNSALKLAPIRDISATGLYLLTEERWPLGQMVSLALQAEGSPENNHDLQVTVQARVTRHGEDGIGLSFVLPAGLDGNLWGVLIKNAVVQTETKGVLFMFRMLRTILFLCRICNGAADESIKLLGGDLNGSRTESALEIALGAEKLLASEPDADRMHAHPPLVANILSNGSWAHNELVLQLWKGLLASSCTVEGTDESNSAFINLLFNVTPNQGQIFVTGCNKAMELMSGTEDFRSPRIILTPEQLSRVTDLPDLSRIANDIDYLFHLGLVERDFDFTSYVPTESFDITPSRLGLEMFKHCKGHYTKPRSLLGESEDAQPLPQPFLFAVNEEVLLPPHPDHGDEGS